MSSPEVLRPLAHWGAGRAGKWSDGALTRARAALSDVIACMAAGAAHPAGQTAYALAGGGDCVIVARPRRASAEMAALINGTAAHALDFDDDFPPARAHAGAPLFPALLALGETRAASMKDVLDAFIVGLEAMGRIGELVNPRHRNAGWHATGTLGPIGAAAACARLLRLDEDAFRNAMALAVSRAGGSMAQFGAMAKPLHAGFAAETGVLCARLAAAGATAAREAVAGPRGLADLMGAGAIGGVDESAIGMPPLIETAGLKIKRYPVCASAHRSLDALLAIRAREAFAPDAVARVEAELPALQLANLMYPAPETPGQARFSLNYALAVGVVCGAPGLADFTDAALRRPDVMQIMPRVFPSTVDTTEINYPTCVTVRLRDGRAFSETVQYAKGAPQNPLSPQELAAKARTCLDASPLAARAGDIIDAFGFDPDQSVAAFMTLLRGPDGAPA